MLRGIIALGASVALLTTANVAGAQDTKGLGHPGQFILSADRLAPIFAYNNDKITHTEGGVTTTSSDSQTVLGLFTAHPLPPTFFMIPRLGFDYVVIPNLTVGANIGLFFGVGGSNSVKVEQAGSSRETSTDAAKITMFGIQPRVGYILPLSDLFAFWPRGGFSFHSISIKEPDTGGNNPRQTTSTTKQLALNVEGVFVITPIEHFAITAAPIIDIPLTGSRSTETTQNGTSQSVSDDAAQFHFGLHVGLMGWFGG